MQPKKSIYKLKSTFLNKIIILNLIALISYLPMTHIGMFRSYAIDKPEISDIYLFVLIFVAAALIHTLIIIAFGKYFLIEILPNKTRLILKITESNCIFLKNYSEENSDHILHFFNVEGPKKYSNLKEWIYILKYAIIILFLIGFLSYDVIKREVTYLSKYENQMQDNKYFKSIYFYKFFIL